MSLFRSSVADFVKVIAIPVFIAVDLAFPVGTAVVGVGDVAGRVVVVVVGFFPNVPIALKSIFARVMHTFEVVVHFIILSISPKSGFLATFGSIEGDLPVAVQVHVAIIAFNCVVF
jgi:hypothetical protein